MVVSVPFVYISDLRSESYDSLFYFILEVNFLLVKIGELMRTFEPKKSDWLPKMVNN